MTWSVVHPLEDGRIVVRHRDLDWMQVLDPATGGWSEVDTAAMGHRGHAQIASTGGRIIVWGGLRIEQLFPNPCGNAPPDIGCDPPGPSITPLTSGFMYFFR